MSEEEPRHKGRLPRRRRITKRVLIGLCVVLVVASTAFVIAYKKLEGNINAISIADALGDDRPDAVEVEGPKKPLNVLVMGSDNRDGTNIGGDTPGLSDTTILLHLSADREPGLRREHPARRDGRAARVPDQERQGEVPGGLTQFNAAYAVGGPACTIKTVEKITNVRIDHFVVINFVGFKEMVNAINGVKVCVPEEVNDDIGHIHLPAGTYKVNGSQALDYVRVRHGIGAETGDIGRMKRQQAFIAAMVEKVVSKGTLANPVRLYQLPRRRDPVADHRHRLRPPQGARLARVVAEEHRARQHPVPHRAQRALRAGPQPPPAGARGRATLWRKIRFDRPAGQARRRRRDARDQARDKPSSSASPSPDGSPSASPSKPDGPSAEERKQAAEEAGLCA